MDVITRNAEELYQRGVSELRYGRATCALLLFRRAVTISREAAQPNRRVARYLSYSGICLHRSGGLAQDALRLCQEAVGIDGNRPSLWRNLASVAVAAGRPGLAHHALNRALAVSPGHRGVATDLRKLGIRRRPVLPFLDRSNTVNVVLGRIRASV